MALAKVSKGAWPAEADLVVGSDDVRISQEDRSASLRAKGELEPSLLTEFQLQETVLHRARLTSGLQLAKLGKPPASKMRQADKAKRAAHVMLVAQVLLAVAALVFMYALIKAGYNLHQEDGAGLVRAATMAISSFVVGVAAFAAWHRLHEVWGSIVAGQDFNVSQLARQPLARLAPYGGWRRWRRSY